MHTKDPVELIIAGALTRAGVAFIHESDDRSQFLDFYLPDYDVYIEAKQYPTPRTASQLAIADNIIVIQGRRSAEVFADLIAGNRPEK